MVLVVGGDDNVDINRAWENITENTKTSVTDSLGYYELKHCNTWFDEKCSKLLDQSAVVDEFKSDKWK